MANGDNRVWKIGSRWGSSGIRVLDMFLNYDCAFFGGAQDQSRMGNWQEVQPGDYLLVTNGATPVAIGRVITPFENYHAQNDIRFCDVEFARLDQEDIQICKVQYILLRPEEMKQSLWGNDGRKRFCRHSNAEQVIAYWNNHYHTDAQNDFSLQCRTVRLCGTDPEQAVFTDNVRYRIPIYQRPYSWGESELRRLFEELRRGFEKQETLFMGTIQLSAPIRLSDRKQAHAESAYDVIDGQQRFSTFLIILSLLEEELNCGPRMRPEQFISRVNRGTAQSDLEEFRQSRQHKVMQSEQGRNPYIRNATIIQHLLEELILTEEIDRATRYREFLKYLETKLQFVVVETHAGLSKTLRIFNTINTTGLDLGMTDLFKIRFYEFRKDVCGDDEYVFNELSSIYEQVEEHNRSNPNRRQHSMRELLSIYQYLLVARCEFSSEQLRMATDTFFERLFDTLLGTKHWDGFKASNSRMQELLQEMLSPETLAGLYGSYKCYINKYEQDADFRVLTHLLAGTRYGQSWKMAVVAHYDGLLPGDGDLKDFVRDLLRILTPPSLLWAKQVSGIWSGLHKILLKLGQPGGIPATAITKLYTTGYESIYPHFDAQQAFAQACEYQITGYPVWKLLLCRLWEYIEQTNALPEELFDNLFRKNIDIEHIQCYTDAENANEVWDKWGPELNRIGNLVLLESWLNRSIGNDKNSKPQAYQASVYKTAQALAGKVMSWSLQDAIDRRAEMTQKLAAFLFPVQEKEKYSTNR